MAHEFLDNIYSDWQSNDPAIPRAKKEILSFFERDDNKENIFYSRQLEIHFENQFYHWITNAALNQLSEENVIKKEVVDVGGNFKLNFYRNNNLRYYKQKQKEIIKAVEYYSNPEFSKALGQHGEIMVSNALFRGGFQYMDKDANSYNGKTWTETKHNFDFIVKKDDVPYGVEVKNTLGYMDNNELKILLHIAGYLDLVPLFFCRMLPGNWINDIYQQHNGVSIILGHQLYPYGEENTAKTIKENLGLPVDSPKELYDSTIKRLIDNHNRVKKYY